MSVLGFREVLPRTSQHRFGESPTAERKYAVTVDAPEATQTIINAIGIFHGSQHPEFSYLRMLNVSVTETDRQHVEVTYSYEVAKQENLDTNPLARPDVWSFSTSGATGPFLYYYHGDGNNDIRPLVNAANDFIDGMTTVVPEVKASISGNRANFPLAIAANVTNAINLNPYLGGAPYTWQCSGVSGQQATEVVNDTEIRYWQITVELIYRKHGYVEKIPHVGMHFIEGGKKRRAWVWNDDGSEKISAPVPQPLTEAGALKFPGGDGEPDQLYRRPFPAVDFSGYFGTPPF